MLLEVEQGEKNDIFTSQEISKSKKNHPAGWFFSQHVDLSPTCQYDDLERVSYTNHNSGVRSFCSWASTSDSCTGCAVH